ncbi:DNA-binding PadR family transcriptional regulator [Kibdelosporangium banguiense]|uniref:DNA-binding PadR family transcriptional regulator n=1 Tax=Kibdelosporangium banguiense TaxID=1365924 RepID=A0ABS4TS92_9PSEU|nr:PadR family transcriptional regulator [Kibdelosporangium banguiense]MBP2327276.1 DNA-binding PadR family transcriptional regulator [Kibdelosporangium banguiense]
MAVLMILAEEPMHPYGLRQRIREWGKDQVVNVTQNNAIYQIIERLERSGLIAVQETARNERRPERTVYKATPEGVRTARSWLLGMLSTPSMEYPEFPAALAFLAAIPDEEKLRTLTERVKALEETLAKMKADIQNDIEAYPGGLDRIYVVEIEYMQAMLEAELRWVRELVDDLRAGVVDSPPRSVPADD